MSARAAAEHGGQVEPEPVDAEVGEPVERPQTRSCAAGDSASMSLPHPVVSMYEPSSRRR